MSFDFIDVSTSLVTEMTFYPDGKRGFLEVSLGRPPTVLQVRFLAGPLKKRGMLGVDSIHVTRRAPRKPRATHASIPQAMAFNETNPFRIPLGHLFKLKWILTFQFYSRFQ